MSKLLELYSDPKHWTQGVLARDSDGCKTATYSERACSFCLVGGIIHEYGYSPGEPEFKELKAKMKETPTWQKYGYENIPDFNDNVDYETMIQMLKECNL